MRNGIAVNGKAIFTQVDYLPSWPFRLVQEKKLPR